MTYGERNETTKEQRRRPAPGPVTRHPLRSWLVLAAAAWASGCDPHAPPPARAETAERATAATQADGTEAAESAADTTPPHGGGEAPFLTLWQRDDRDVVSVQALRSSRVPGDVVLVAFRQPNRQHEAGFVILLDEHRAGISEAPRAITLPLPARENYPAEVGTGDRRPSLALLEAFGDPEGKLWVTDLSPSEDPLGGAMVGAVHQLTPSKAGTPLGLVSRRMTPPPAGYRWAGPSLVSVIDGAVTVVLSPTPDALTSPPTGQPAGGAGEAIFQPQKELCGATPLARFLATKRSPERYRSWFQSPKRPLPGSSIQTLTSCDADGCRTTLRREAAADTSPLIAAHSRGHGPDHVPPREPERRATETGVRVP